MNLINELLAHFDTPQKTAEEIQAIPEDNKIYLLHWSDKEKLGWFTTELHYKWWPKEVKPYTKEWLPWDFEDFIKADGYKIEGSFWEWFNDWTLGMQKILVYRFIEGHEPMIRKELETHYSKHKLA